MAGTDIVNGTALLVNVTVSSGYVADVIDVVVNMPTSSVYNIINPTNADGTLGDCLR